MASDKIDFNKMYYEFENRYNNLPVDMSRSEAFTRAKRDGLIDEETYLKARKYFGNLWFYVGD